jgi:hypothetical protein
MPASTATSTAIMTEEELIALTKSETEPVVELPTAPATVRPPLAPALSAEVCMRARCCHDVQMQQRS